MHLHQWRISTAIKLVAMGTFPGKDSMRESQRQRQSMIGCKLLRGRVVIFGVLRIGWWPMLHFQSGSQDVCKADREAVGEHTVFLERSSSCQDTCGPEPALWIFHDRWTILAFPFVDLFRRNGISITKFTGFHHSRWRWLSDRACMVCHGKRGR